MLILPQKDLEKQRKDDHKGIMDHFNKEMEKILNENSNKQKYWILGKSKTHQHRGKTIIRPFLQACDEKPGLIKESFVYEVDNTRGAKTLLWVFHPGDILSFPTLGKTISVKKNGVAKPMGELFLPAQ